MCFTSNLSQTISCFSTAKTRSAGGVIQHTVLSSPVSRLFLCHILRVPAQGGTDRLLAVWGVPGADFCPELALAMPRRLCRAALRGGLGDSGSLGPWSVSPRGAVLAPGPAGSLSVLLSASPPSSHLLPVLYSGSLVLLCLGEVLQMVVNSIAPSISSRMICLVCCCLG